MPVTAGPGASPSRLWASVSVANAVAAMAAGVRFATMAAPGPAVPAHSRAPSASASSCTGPAGRRNAVISSTSEPTLQQMATDHLRIGSRRLKRSEAIPPVTMPMPIIRAKSPAVAPAFAVGIS